MGRWGGWGCGGGGWAGRGHGKKTSIHHNAFNELLEILLPSYFLIISTVQIFKLSNVQTVKLSHFQMFQTFKLSNVQPFKLFKLSSFQAFKHFL